MSMETHGVLAAAEPKAIALYCLDPRFQKAFQFFFSKELNLDYGDYIPIVIAGGASILARPDDYREDFEFAISQIDFALLHFPSVEEIMLFNHKDCGRVICAEPQSIDDLRNAAANIESHFSWPSTLKIKLYYASFDSIRAVPRLARP